jgi:hypothetical protein
MSTTVNQGNTSDTYVSQAKRSGVQSAVKVNHRMLIDKILARYSSDFVVCRELIQNADDARATSFSFEFICEPTGSRRETLHNSNITEIRAVNNGAVFEETDWIRVASIAEGNTNIESVGQFGVGFFSVFSFAEEPIIVSGKQFMVFTWQNDDSLTTYRCALPAAQHSHLTSIILKVRSKYILNTEKTFAERETELYSQSVTNDKTVATGKAGVIPTIVLSQIKAYFTKGKYNLIYSNHPILCEISSIFLYIVLSFTSNINEVSIKINGSTIFQVNKKKQQIVSLNSATSTFEINSISNMLRLDTFEQTEQTFSIANGPSITMIHINVEATVHIDEEFHSQIRRILKKDFPPTIRIQLLHAPNNVS